jgi:hypothetical protein
MPYAKNKNIRVVITKDASGQIEFGLQQSSGWPAKQKVSFHNGGHPGVMIYFEIDDQDNSGLTFQPAPADAIWAAPPGAPWPAPPNCPANAPPPWAELVPLSVERDNQGNNTLLIVYFRNSNPGVLFPFALRFVGPHGPVNYDPIGDGNNGLRF